MTPQRNEELHGASAGAPQNLVVTEGIAGMWHYHLSHADTKHRAICGAQTMHTSIPRERFGIGRPVSNQTVPSSWCRKCMEKVT